MEGNYRAFFARKWSQVNRKQTDNAKIPIKFPPFDSHNSPVNEQICVFTYFSLFAINLRVLSNVLLHVSTVSTRTR
jgi:hypothetical protein